MKQKLKGALSIILSLALIFSFLSVGSLSRAEGDENSQTPEPTATIIPTSEASENKTPAEENKDGLIGEARSDDEAPLAIGEIETIQTDHATFTISLDENAAGTGTLTEEVEEDKEESPGFFESILDFFFPSTVSKAASDTMKVSYSGYVSYCGHRMGYKYISSDGDYKNQLVFCMNIAKNTTSGTVTSGGKNIPVNVLFCLVNGARTKGGQCHTEKYSAGSAEKDYFITSAAIHVLNGEVKLSYYDDGSAVFKKIKAMVEDAKNLDKSEYDTSKRTTKSITYTVSPKSSKWKQIDDGLYRSEDKFVRTKSGSIERVDYKITGAPSGLTTGEIPKSSTDIAEADDLARYDICVAQTNTDNASSNFYLYANQEAMDKIIEKDATIKVTATVYSKESRGRSWTPTIVSQQKITFLEKNIITPPVTASVKVRSAPAPLGSLVLKKTDTYKPDVTVKDAVYGLYEDPECEELLCELSWKDEEGGLYASDVQELTQNTYYLREIINPEGYQLDETIYPIDISYFTLKDASDHVTQEGRVFELNEIPEPVSVMVQKKDSVTGDVLKNAQFAIFDDEACTIRTKVDPLMGNNAEVPIFSYDEDLDAYVSEQFAKVNDFYFVREVNVPGGYVDDGTVHKINPDYGEMITIDITNTPIKCEVNVKKEDKEKKLPQGDAKLSGALYGLYAKTDIKHTDGENYMRGTEVVMSKGTDFTAFDVDATAGTLLATIRTDENGEFGFKELYFSDYVIQEIEPSVGYLIDPTPYDILFTSKGNTTATITIDETSKEQVMKQAAEIIKISTDGKTTEAPKVEGAEFTIKLKSEIEKVGWDAAETYDTMVTDKNGHAKTIELPYGTYVVRETKTPPDLDTVPDFEIDIDHDDRESQPWRILNDAPFTSYIRLIKKDKETGEVVLLKDTTFKIRKAGETDFITQKVGDKDITEFSTDETGTVTTPLRLMYGNYEAVEVRAPDKYLLSTEPTPFTVTSTGAVKVDRDKDGDPVIDVEIVNEPVMGKIKIIKTGEVLSGIRYDTILDRFLDAITGDNRSVTFQYEPAPLSGAVFDVISDEDIFTPDHQLDKDGKRIIATYNGKPMKKNEVIATITTDANGEATVDGLPLGKYHLVETFSPKGFLPPESIESIDLKYLDDHTAVVESESKIENTRQRTEVKLIKTEAPVYGEAVSGSATTVPTETVSGGAAFATSGSATGIATPTVTTGSAITVSTEAASGSSILLNDGSAGTPVAGATYGIYSTTPIKNYKGEVLIEANTLIEVEKTDENGEIVFTADLPLGKFYIREITPAPGFLLDPSEYELDLTEPDSKAAVIKKEYDVTDFPIIIQVSKEDIATSNPIPDATLQIIDHNDEVFAEWISESEPYTVTAIPPGDYTLRETSAPFGFFLATEAKFTVTETHEIEKVVMVDERAKGILEIIKTDRETGEEIMGVEFEILDESGNVVETIKTDADGIARSHALDIGEYNPDGTFKRLFTYSVKETKAAEGYIINDSIHNIRFEYKDNVSEPIIARLQVTNQPTEPKLPQTGGDPTLLIYGFAIGLGAGIGVYLHKRKKKKNGGK